MAQLIAMPDSYSNTDAARHRPRWVYPGIFLLVAGNLLWLNVFPSNWTWCPVDVDASNYCHGWPWCYMVCEYPYQAGLQTISGPPWPITNAAPILLFSPTAILANAVFGAFVAVVLAVSLRRLAKAAALLGFASLAVWPTGFFLLTRSTNESLGDLAFAMLVPDRGVPPFAALGCSALVCVALFRQIMVPKWIRDQQFGQWASQIGAILVVAIAVIGKWFGFELDLPELTIGVIVTIAGLTVLAVIARLAGWRREAQPARQLLFRLRGAPSHAWLAAATVAIGAGYFALFAQHVVIDADAPRSRIPHTTEFGWPFTHLCDVVLFSVDSPLHGRALSRESYGFVLPGLGNLMFVVVLTLATWIVISRIRPSWGSPRFRVSSFLAIMIFVAVGLTVPPPGATLWDYDPPEYVFVAATYFGIACATYWFTDGLPRTIADGLRQPPREPAS